MVKSRLLRARAPEGVALIEALVAMVVISVALIGLAGLQLKLQTSEFEAYQRSQAMVLLNDMSDRILLNRVNVSSYLIAASSPTGVDATCPSVTSTATRDISDWCKALQGASEQIGTKKLGVLIGGRGCVESVTTGTYRVTVAWQGSRPLTSPATACAKNLYNDTASCLNDRCRRVVTTLIQVNSLATN